MLLQEGLEPLASEALLRKYVMGKGYVGLAFYKLALLLAHGDVKSLQLHSCWHELYHIFPHKGLHPPNLEPKQTPGSSPCFGQVMCGSNEKSN